MHRRAGAVCGPPGGLATGCQAYDENAFRHCLVLDAVVAHKRMADKLAETAAQIAQQIEFGQHPK